MVGMSQIKKKVLQGMAIGIGIGIIGVGGTVFWAVSTIKTYEDGTNKKFIQNFMQEVNVLNRDVLQGEIIQPEDVQTVTVHKNTVPSGALSAGAVSGRVAKYNIPSNIPITQEMITDSVIDGDIRDQEINTVLLPSDLTDGEYIDVRIMYPNGTDYIVLSQKRTDKIVGNTMWLKLSEDERLLLNGAVVDSYLNEGTKLYATKYSDSDSQIQTEDSEQVQKLVKARLSEVLKGDTTDGNVTEEELAKQVETLFSLILEYKNFASSVIRATENYQPNSQIIAAMNSNKNVVAAAKQKLSEEARTVIENAITEYKSRYEDQYDGVVNGVQESIQDQKTQRQDLLNVE